MDLKTVFIVTAMLGTALFPGTARTQEKPTFSGIYSNIVDNSTNELAFVLEEDGSLRFGLTRLFEGGAMCAISAGRAALVARDTWLFSYTDAVIPTEQTDFFITYRKDGSVKIKEAEVSGSTGHMGVCGRGAFIGEFTFARSDYCGPATPEMTSIITEDTVCSGIGAPLPDRN